MNNKERLSRLIAQYQKNMEFYRNAREFNEQDCRDEFISPLLESFGWDVHTGYSGKTLWMECKT